MQYLSSKMIKDKNITSISMLLKMCLIDGIEMGRADARNGQMIIFNEGINSNKHTKYTLSDGTAEVETYLKQIDLNTIQACEDIENLKGDITLSITKPQGWRYEENNNIHSFSNQFATVIVNENTKKYKILRDNESSSEVGISSINGFSSIIYNESSFVTIVIDSRWGLTGYYFLNTPILSVINDLAYSSSGEISQIRHAVIKNGTQYGSNEIIQRNTSSSFFANTTATKTDEYITFSPIFIKNIRLPFVLQAIGGIQRSEEDIFLYQDDIVICAMPMLDFRAMPVMIKGERDDRFI